MAVVLMLVGALVVVAGVGWVSVPAAVIVAGAFLLAAGIDLARGDDS